MKSSLYQKYLKEIIPALREKFGYGNKLAVPKIEKVTVNSGINSREGEQSRIQAVEETLAKITGQRPVKTKARQAISAFRIRQGMIVGMKTTVRGRRMYDFLDKLINVVLPRTRDFRGLSPNQVDRQGNLTIGIKEHNVFPEIQSDEVEKLHGLEITVTTTSKDRQEGLELLRLLGFPFKK